MNDIWIEETVDVNEQPLNDSNNEHSKQGILDIVSAYVKISNEYYMESVKNILELRLANPDLDVVKLIEDVERQTAMNLTLITRLNGKGDDNNE